MVARPMEGSCPFTWYSGIAKEAVGNQALGKVGGCVVGSGDAGFCCLNLFFQRLVSE